jgi:hypothetical protein
MPGETIEQIFRVFKVKPDEQNTLIFYHVHGFLGELPFLEMKMELPYSST